jgi:hypothetical protein
MDMESALRARLLAAGPITTLAGQRVTWVERPQTAGLPAITLQIVTDDRSQSFSGFDGLQPGYVQVDVWATSYAQAKALKEAVINAAVPTGTFFAVRFTRGFIAGGAITVERVDNQSIFRASIDLTFHYATA